jgi:hypothetical protein
MGVVGKEDDQIKIREETGKNGVKDSGFLEMAYMPGPAELRNMVVKA